MLNLVALWKQKAPPKRKPESRNPEKLPCWYLGKAVYVETAAMADQQGKLGPQFISSCSLCIGGHLGAGYITRCPAWVEGRESDGRSCTATSLADAVRAGKGRVFVMWVFRGTPGNR